MAMELCFATARVLSEPGCISNIDQLKKLIVGNEVAAVIDPFLSSTPACDRFSNAIETICGKKPRLILAPAQEPDIADVARVADELAQHAFDTLFVIGGGSAIDTAKAARMCLANDGSPQEVAALGLTMRDHSSRFIAAPTTAGTGSEVTEFAVFNKAGEPIKIVFHSQDMAPYCALLDAELSVTAPASVTAAAGIDALTHAIEAFIAKRANPITDALALDSIKRLIKFLPVAYTEPSCLEARDECLTASCQAGFAFNCAGLGLAHALSAPLGVRWHVAHGVANALALPAVMAFNAPAIGDKEGQLAHLFGTKSSAEGIARLRFDLGLDLSLDQFVPSELEREELVVSSMHSKQIANNPRALDAKNIRAVVEAMRAPIGKSASSLFERLA